MDSIWNCAFGLDIDLQNDPDNLFLKNSCEHIQNTAEFGVFRLFSCRREPIKFTNFI